MYGYEPYDAYKKARRCLTDFYPLIYPLHDRTQQAQNLHNITRPVVLQDSTNLGETLRNTVKYAFSNYGPEGREFESSPACQKT